MMLAFVRVQSTMNVDPHLVIPELLQERSHGFPKRANKFLHMHTLFGMVSARRAASVRLGSPER